MSEPGGSAKLSSISTLFVRLDGRLDCIRWPWVALALFTLAFLLRLPFFFPAVIGWDESTYILLGQDVLNGNLPYERFWDLKPPLAYVAYAAAIAAFGHTVEGVRFAGTLCIAAAALAVYIAARRQLGGGRAALVGILAIVGLLQQEAGYATLTEHFAIAPLCAAFALLVRAGDDRRAIALAGLLLAFATLVRTNLAYVSLLVTVALVLRPGRRAPSERLRDVLALGLPAAGLIVVCVLPYMLAGKLPLLRAALIEAPLAYSQVQHDVFDSIFKLIRGVGVRSNPPLALLLWGAGSLGAGWIAWTAIRERGADRLAYWLPIFLFSASYSVLASGGGYGHYLIQLAPFYALSSVFFVTAAASARYRMLGAVLAGLALAFALKPVGSEYATLAQRLAGGEGLRSGRALAVAEYIAREAPPGAPVYLMADHLAYWLLGTEPLTRMTAHPSNFSKPFLLRAAVGPDATPTSELRRVFDLQPLLVIKPERVEYLERDPGAVALLTEELSARYTRVAAIDGLAVFRLKSHGQ